MDIVWRKGVWAKQVHIRFGLNIGLLVLGVTSAY